MSIYAMPQMPPWGPESRPLAVLVGSCSGWQEPAARELVKAAGAIVTTEAMPAGPQRAQMVMDLLVVADVVMIWIDDHPCFDWLDVVWALSRIEGRKIAWGSASLDNDPEWEPGGHLRFLVAQNGGVIHPNLEQTLAATSETARLMRQYEG